jgi:hypothetical protein
MIRIAQMPASITGDFITAVVFCAREKLRVFKEYPLDRYERRDKRTERATAIKYLVPFAERDRSALDELLSRLRKLKYASCEFRKGELGFSDGHFLGFTLPLVMSASSKEKWDIGRYVVKVPVMGVLNKDLGHFTMRPAIEYPDSVQAFHPHHTQRGTCWSQWQYSLTEACGCCNFDQLFGMFILFLQSYYPGSPLARPPEYGETREVGENMYWMRMLSEPEVISSNRRR